MIIAIAYERTLKTSGPSLKKIGFCLQETLRLRAITDDSRLREPQHAHKEAAPKRGRLNKGEGWGRVG
jgi:hypothetical protein